MKKRHTVTIERDPEGEVPTTPTALTLVEMEIHELDRKRGHLLEIKRAEQYIRRIRGGDVDALKVTLHTNSTGQTWAIISDGREPGKGVAVDGLDNGLIAALQRAVVELRKGVTVIDDHLNRWRSGELEPYERYAGAWALVREES